MFFSRRHAYTVADDLDLVPSAQQMRREGGEILEAWFRGSEEWRLLMGVFGGLSHDSWVLEIGCGSGRNTFALRHTIARKGHYTGLDVDRAHIEELDASFAPRFIIFRFGCIAGRPH